jgi:hypothetical protein
MSDKPRIYFRDGRWYCEGGTYHEIMQALTWMLAQFGIRDDTPRKKEK